MCLDYIDLHIFRVKMALCASASIQMGTSPHFEEKLDSGEGSWDCGPSSTNMEKDVGLYYWRMLILVQLN